MELKWHDMSELNHYFSGKYPLFGIKLPRKKKKEFKKSDVYYDKDLDLVIITKGKKRKEVSFERFFEKMHNEGELMSVLSLEMFIIKQISML